MTDKSRFVADRPRPQTGPETGERGLEAARGRSMEAARRSPKPGEPSGANIEKTCNSGKSGGAARVI